jgi:hypothetical protein
VLDSVPGEVNSEDSSDEVEKVLHTLKSLPPHPPSRKYTLSLFVFEQVSVWLIILLVPLWSIHAVFLSFS